MNEERPRAREAGIVIGGLQTGPFNAITDVPGVRVGHITLIDGEGPLRIGEGPVRTGVTAILPPGDDWWSDPVEAGCHVINGAGTTAGLSFIDEYHRIETPVMLTNTLSVGSVYEGVVRYMVDNCFRKRGDVPWHNPVVGETSDAFLNDIGGLHVRPEHAIQAISLASEGPVEEGAVGAGTGTSALGWKAGIGTSSRRVELKSESSVVGVLVQSNFGGILTVSGIQMPDLSPVQPDRAQGASIMIVLATDLPISGHGIERVCRRATYGLARTGSRGGHGSGDYVIGFSTTYRKAEAKAATRKALNDQEGLIDRAFVAVADATEEAILNSLFQATRVVGRDDNVREALPIDPVLEKVRTHGLLVED